MKGEEMEKRWKMCLDCGAICFPQGKRTCFCCQGIATEKEEVTLAEINELRRLIKLWKLDRRVQISIWFRSWKNIPRVLTQNTASKEI